MTATVPAAVTPRGVRELIHFALEALPAMRRDDGAFCFERRVGERAPLGRSPRYTLMVELGLLRAQAAGYALPFDLDELDSVAWREIDGPDLTPGDIGLMLWIDARREGERGGQLADRLQATLASTGGLEARVGMELGWIVTGLAHHVAAGGGGTGAKLLSESLDQLLLRNRAPTDLFRHFGAPGMAPSLPELRHADLLGAGARGRRPPQPRPPRAARCPRDGGSPAGGAARRRRLALAFRCRAWDGRGAL